METSLSSTDMWFTCGSHVDREGEDEEAKDEEEKDKEDEEMKMMFSNTMNSTVWCFEPQPQQWHLQDIHKEASTHKSEKPMPAPFFCA